MKNFLGILLLCLVLLASCAKPTVVNVALPDDAKPDVERTIPRHNDSTKPYPDDIDLE